MSRISRSEVLGGMVLPAVLLVVMAFLVLTADDPSIPLALLAVVPLVSAILAPMLGVTVMAVASTAAAVITGAMASGSAFGDAVPLLLVVIVASGVSVMLASQRPVPLATPTVAQIRVEAQPEPELWDDLTQLATRAAIEGEVTMLPVGGQGWLALLDVDDLGRINAEHGSGVADTVLFAVAGRLRHSLNERGAQAGDALARWGDDQFLIVVAGEAEESRSAVLAMVDKVNANPMRTDAGLISVTMCAGIAAWHAGQPLREVVDQAHGCLHRAKACGPGQVSVDTVPSKDP